MHIIIVARTFEQFFSGEEKRGGRGREDRSRGVVRKLDGVKNKNCWPLVIYVMPDV